MWGKPLGGSTPLSRIGKARCIARRRSPRRCDCSDRLAWVRDGFARQLGLPRPTVRDWHAGKLPRHSCARATAHGSGDHWPARPAGAAALRNTGSGALNRLRLSTRPVSGRRQHLDHPQRRLRLRVSLDKKYPRIIEECAAAMQAVVAWSKVHRLPTPTNSLIVCLLQVLALPVSPAWPGSKHARKSRLRLAAGAGSRSRPRPSASQALSSLTAAVSSTPEAVGGARRTTRSQSLHRHQAHLLRSLRLAWAPLDGAFRHPSAKSVYVSRKADVARLDEFVGPKR